MTRSGSLRYPERQDEVPGLLPYLIGEDRLGCRSSGDLPASAIELRAVPGTLHHAFDHDPIRERATPVSAPIVEHHVTLLGSGEHQPLAFQVEQLHLVDLELVCSRHDQRL